MSSHAPPGVDGALAYYPVLYTCCAFMLLAGAATRNRPVPAEGERRAAPC
ncbi:hypothetical protein [Streptosporangium sp. V21-05]